MIFKRTDHRETTEFKNCRLAVLSVFQQGFSKIEEEQSSVMTKPLSHISSDDKVFLDKVVACDKAMKELYQEYSTLFNGLKKFDYNEKERYFERAINSTLRMLTKEQIKSVSSSVSSSSSSTAITANKSWKGKTSEELYKEYINS